jgi:hypothetical protein
MAAQQDLGFTGALLDRADHLRCNCEALEALRTGPTARFAAFTELKPILDGGSPVWFTASEIPPGLPSVFLGLRNGEAYFAVNLPPGTGQEASPSTSEPQPRKSPTATRPR